MIEQIGPKARLTVVDAARLMSAIKSSCYTWIGLSSSVVQYSAKPIGLLIRQGPGPTNCSRGTLAKALTTGDVLTLAVKRNSAAYHWRACSTGSNIAPALTRLSRSRGFWNFDKVSRFHVVDVAVNRNVIGDQRMVSDPRDILENAFSVV